MLKRIVPAFVIILLLLTFFLSYGNEEPTPGFSFAFMTDIHVQPELQADARFHKAIAKVNELGPDFVITGGDMIMDALGQTEKRSMQLYNMYDELMAAFNMPVYNTMGNHEVFGLYTDSGIEPEHPQYGKIMYANRLGQGKTYYSFDHKNWHFIVLDAIGFTGDRHYFGHIDSVQLDWLKRDLLATGRKKPIVVSLHIPLVSVYGQMKDGATTALDDGAVVTNSVEVIKAFEGYHLKLVLQGHLHIVEEIIYNDVHYITGGAVCGAWWKGPRDGFPPGFVMVNVKGNDFTWSYETFHDRVPPEEASE